MIRKFYDAYAWGEGSSNYVVDTENKTDKTVIECECGSHMLQVVLDCDIYTNKDGSKQVQQSYYFAMFNYGNYKRKIFGRLKIALKYLRTGEMFTDQLTLNEIEAEKLSNFINSTIIKTQQP